jgi:hypothetical protein
MTWLREGWHWLYLAAILLAVAGWALYVAVDIRRHNVALMERQLDAQDTDLDLTEIHHETMRDLRQADGPAGGESPVPADGEPLPLDLPEVDDPPERRLLPPGGVAPLTPKQRRRAVHKGRIPRNLPGSVEQTERIRADGVDERRAGESTERLIGGVLAAELETGRLVATMRDEAREAEAAAVWAEIGGLVDDAYRWWSAPGRWELAA